ncbi:MAG: hypothetical protein LUE11_08775 [Clostridia bacterium]|nr:hypothetical protein [Clostridia bacterium]
MLGNKRGKLVLILAVLVAVAAVSRIYWTSSLPEHAPGGLQLQEHTTETTTSEESGAETKEIVIGEDVILSILQETLDNQISISDLSAEIDDGAGVSVTGNVNKSDIAKLLETQDGSIAQSYKAVLDMFPDSLPLELKIWVKISESKTAELMPGGLSIGSMEIPDSMLEENFYDKIESSFNRELQKQITSVDTVAAKDGNIVITGT